MSSLCPHDLYDRIVVVATGRMYRYSCRLVDDDHAIVFVYDANRLGGNGRFVSMQGIRNQITISNDDVFSDFLAINFDDACPAPGCEP